MMPITVRNALACMTVFLAGTVMVDSQESFSKREAIAQDTTPGIFLGTAPSPPAAFTLPLPAEGVEPVTLPPDGWALDPESGKYYRASEMLVKFASGVSVAQRAIAMRVVDGLEVSPVLPDNWQLVSVPVGADRPVSSALRAMRAQAGVESAFLNYRVEPSQVRPNDQSFNLQWNFDAIHVPTAWSINPGATSSVIVAVVDTGLNTVDNTIAFSGTLVGQVALRFATNPDLKISSNVTRPFDFVYNDTTPLDMIGHGTHVAGTIAQATNNNIGLAGIAYNVKLMPVKVLMGGLDAVLRPGNPGGSDATVAAGIMYAANNGANVINLSLGRSGGGPAPVVADALRYAVSHGAFVAIAAGNDNEHGNPTHYPAVYGSDIAGVMAVGAVDRNLRHASYSETQPYVEICAPGGDSVFSETDYADGVSQVTYRGEDSWSGVTASQAFTLLRAGLRPRFDQFYVTAYEGTSMATPHVAAVAALLYSQGIHDPAVIESAIKQFATPISATANECGVGLIDARRVLMGLGLAK
jgi:serine protease